MEEFFLNIKSDYPNLDFEQLKDICFGPWRFLKQEMESGNLNGVRFKYFGVFQVYPGRAKYMIYTLNKKLEEGKIDKERHLKLTTMINNYLKRL